eukprot:9164314-Karenia_brevis.AAC.1
MSRSWNPGQKRHRQKGSSKGSAYYADGAEDWEEEEGFDEPPNDAAYKACSSDEGSERDEEEEGVPELEYADTAQEAAERSGIAYQCDLHGEEAITDIEDVQKVAAELQDLNVAFASSNKGRGKGGRYPMRPSHLSVADRKAKLQDLKSRTDCTA